MTQQENTPDSHGGNTLKQSTESVGVHGGNGIKPNTDKFGASGAHGYKQSEDKPVITIETGSIKLSIYVPL